VETLRKWRTEKEREVYGLIWGESGTREGATKLQVASVGWLWSRYDISLLHNGAYYRGVDRQLYHLAKGFQIPVILHPPHWDDIQVFWGIEDEQRDAAPSLVRNKNIILESECMVAIPRGIKEELRSGTWMTVRHTRKQSKPLAIVWPNGLISYENWEQMRKI
jgi:hypothetical protein